MIMTRKYYLIAMLLLAAALVVTVIAYPQLPDFVPTHWNIRNQVNGYSPKWALFLFGPGLMAIMIGIFVSLPWLSPKQFEVDSFRATSLYIMLIVVSLVAYLHGVTLWAALGHPINVGRAVVGGVSLLFALLGNVLGKVRRNFYIGVRTPWALANDRVWNATHRFAGKIFMVAGVVGLVLTAIGVEGWLPLTPLMIGPIVAVLYSLVFYKQLERRGEL
jgi:uncharacterized membrane protein